MQSRTDKRLLDIKGPLLKVFKDQAVNFVQCYVDSPHCHLGRGYSHPISGCVTLCDLSHPKTKAAMQESANKYLASLQDILLKLRGNLGLRLEYVSYLDGSSGFPTELQPDHGKYWDMEALDTIFQEYTVVLPFTDTDSEKFVEVIHNTLDLLTSNLSSIYLSNTGKGEFEAAWRAFQLELACEEILYGHPLSAFDTHFAASLGTSTLNVRSASHCRGFIGLAPYNSASFGQSPPPVYVWTKNKDMIARVERLWPLTNTLGAGEAVVGAEMLRVALCDLFKGTAKDVPWGALASDKLPEGFYLQGSIIIEKLASDLATSYRFSFPHVFGRGLALVRDAGLDPVKCMVLGMGELKLTHFPKMSMVDKSKNYCVRKIPNLYLAINKSDAEAPIGAQMATLAGDICCEIERRGLSYSRNLERYRLTGFPWLEVIVRRLPALSKPAQLKQLTFLSCVGMRMNGDYIEYIQLRELVRELTFPQSVMQRRLIQSQELIHQVTALKVWKLHPSVPYKVTAKPPPLLPKASAPKEEASTIREPEDLREMNPDEVPCLGISASQVVANTANYIKWSSAELDLVPLDKTLTARQAYNRYVKQCQMKVMHIRTFKAFKHKRLALLAS